MTKRMAYRAEIYIWWSENNIPTVLGALDSRNQEHITPKIYLPLS